MVQKNTEMKMKLTLEEEAPTKRNQLERMRRTNTCWTRSKKKELDKDSKKAWLRV